MSVVRTTCLKCGTEQLIQFGDLGFADALAALDKWDIPRECPGGFHVELGGWAMLWQFGSALVAVFGDEAKKSTRVQTMIEREVEYGKQIGRERAKPVLEPEKQVA